MFVKPRSAFVGCPSVVCSSSGSAKNPRYARLFPSTRKSSASRAGPSSRTSSSPVSVFGTAQLYGPTTGRSRDAPRPRSGRLQGSIARPGTSTRRFLDLRKTQLVCPRTDSLRLAHRPRPDRRRRRGRAPARSAVARRRRRGSSAGCAALSARGRAARGTGAERRSRHRRGRARCAPAARRADRSATRRARDRARRAVDARRPRRASDDPRRRRSLPSARATRARAAAASSAGTGLPRDASSSTTLPIPTSSRSLSPTAPTRASIAPSWRPISSWSCRPPRRSSMVGRAPSSLRATRRRLFARPARTRSCRPPASPPGSWRSALEEALGRRCAQIGVSLALDHPRLTGRFRDYPHAPAALRHVSSSPLRRLYSLLPAGARREVLRDQGRVLATTAVFAGSPSVAHAEALIRTIELRGARLAEPVDALVVGVPWIGQHLPRELLNPVTSAATALGLALRLWRDAFPIREDGTLILVHSLARSFAHGTQEPYRRLFDTLASGDASALAAAEQAAALDDRAVAAYRAGRYVPPAAPACRLGRMSACTRSPRSSHRRGKPRRCRRTRTRFRPEPLDLERARDGARASQVGAHESASFWRRRTSRSWSGAPQPSPR